MRFNILIGGEAGLGPNILTEVLSECLIKSGYCVFYSREYQSLIRGGHNFNIVTISDSPLFSNDSKIDLIICLDEKTETIHKSNLKKDAIILKGQRSNMYFAGAITKILGIELTILKKSLEKLKNYEENIENVKKGYNEEKRKIILKRNSNEINYRMLNGTQGIVIGAMNSGLEYYYAYPMTPATPLMMELGLMQINKETKHKVIELENEIAVINAATGSSMMGKKSMVGTSGGGFDLMTETISMLGQAEIPLVIYLASRPGPSTGLATYTSQSDLNLALYSGHGEFNRIVLSPGDPAECAELTNQAFYLSEKFNVPAIILSDKHLAESKSLTFKEIKTREIKTKSNSPKKFNSFEHDNIGLSTEDSEIAKKNMERRLKIKKDIENECLKLDMTEEYGNTTSKNLIISFGSPKGAILDSIKENKLNAKFIQIKYLSPFPKKIEKEIKNSKICLVIENNATGQLSNLITKETGIKIEEKNKILKYDGRPFLCDILSNEIKKRLK